MDGFCYWGLESKNTLPLNYGNKTTIETLIVNDKKYIRQRIYSTSYATSTEGYVILTYTKKDLPDGYYTDPTIGICKLANGDMGGTWVYTDEFGQPVNIDTKTYFNNHPIFSALTDVIIDGQHMVRHKKFYYKLLQIEEGPYKGCWTRVISPEPKEGFTLAPSFIYNGEEVDEWYCAKYQTVADDNGLPASLPDRVPLVNLAEASCRTKIQSISTEECQFDMWNIYQLAEIQLLMLFEYATANLNSAIGMGAYGHSTDTSPFKVDDPEVATASWRNHVGLWGNVWQHVWGIYANTSTSTYYLLDPQDNTLKNTDVSVPVYSAITYPVNLNTEVSSSNPYYTFLTLPGSLNTDISVSTIPNAFYGKAASPSYTRSDCLFGGTVRMALGTVGPFVFYFTQNSTTVSAYHGSRMSCIPIVDTNKTIVGKYIDGKTIYRKVFPISDFNIGKDIVTSQLGEIDSLIDLYGSVNCNNEIINFNTVNYKGWVRAIGSNHNIAQVINNSNTYKDCICTIEYTLKINKTNIDSENSYSLEETKIGTWINGKPLYRKVIEANSPTTANTWVITDISDLNIDEVITLNGFVHSDTEAKILINTPNYFRSYIDLNDNIFRLRQDITSWTTNPPVYVTIEYTKTTDNVENNFTTLPYSLEETLLDFTVDDKPVYQKVFELPPLSEINVEQSTDISDLNIDRIIKMDGMSISDNKCTINIEWFNGSEVKHSTYISDNELIHISYDNAYINALSTHVILQYTKKK